MRILVVGTPIQLNWVYQLILYDMGMNWVVLQLVQAQSSSKEDLLSARAIPVDYSVRNNPRAGLSVCRACRCCRCGQRLHSGHGLCACFGLQDVKVALFEPELDACLSIGYVHVTVVTKHHSRGYELGGEIRMGVASNVGVWDADLILAGRQHCRMVRYPRTEIERVIQNAAFIHSL